MDLASSFGLLFDHKTFDFIFTNTGVIGTISRMAGAIALLLTACGFIYEFWNMIQGQHANIWGLVLRVGLVTFILANYTVFAQNSLNYFDAMTKDIMGTTDVVKIKDYYANTQQGAKDATQAEDDSVANGDASIQISSFAPQVDFFHFRFETLLAIILLGLCQIAIVIVCYIRNAMIALLIVAGKLCIVGFATEKTQKLATGWVMSLFCAYTWPVWLAIILWIQSHLMGNMFKSNDYVDIINGCAYCLIFLILYVRVFTMNRDILAGVAGGVAGEVAAIIGTGAAAKAAKGAVKWGSTKKLSGGSPSSNSSSGNGGGSNNGGNSPKGSGGAEATSAGGANSNMVELDPPSARDTGGTSQTSTAPVSVDSAPDGPGRSGEPVGSDSGVSSESAYRNYDNVIPFQSRNRNQNSEKEEVPPMSNNELTNETKNEAGTNNTETKTTITQAEKQVVNSGLQSQGPKSKYEMRGNMRIVPLDPDND